MFYVLYDNVIGIEIVLAIVFWVAFLPGRARRNNNFKCNYVLHLDRMN
jgi:hypothetical protein